MLKLNNFLLLPYSAKKMYNIVNNVHDYSNFLPGCTESYVLDYSNIHMVASMSFSKLGLKNNTIVTYNNLIHNKSINIKLINGPFKELLGYWKFIELENNLCKVIFNLEFEFYNLLTNLTFEYILKNLTNKIIYIFVKRAKKIYDEKKLY